MTTKTTPEEAPVRDEQDQDEAAGSPLLTWHERLQQRRGLRAELRRCDQLGAVFLCEGFYDLRRHADQDRRLQDAIRRQPSDACWALTAVALAHVEAHEAQKHDHHTFAHALATPDESGRATMSELRFRRLITCDTPEALMPLLLRAIRMAGRRADLYSLAQDLLRWGDDEPGQRVRRRWARDYFETATRADA